MSSTLAADFTLPFMDVNLVRLVKRGSPEGNATVKPRPAGQGDRRCCEPSFETRTLRRAPQDEERCWPG
jgi:hypothetical protein